MLITHTHKKRAYSRIAGAKSQSAMEYLMTYGWSILIIAIVLAALFQLGVFNSTNFAPKAPPGACQVFRPNGPGTTSFINTEGVCNGELPQYVAQDKRTGDINIPSIKGLPILAEPRTVTVWFLTNGTGGGNVFNYGIDACNLYWFNINVGQYAGYAEINTCGSNLVIGPVSPNKWYFAAFEYNGSTEYGSLSSPGGQLISVSNGPFIFNTPSSSFTIGYGFDPPSGYFNGSVANVQIYNTSLSSNEIQAIYVEGIGGAPIDLQNLVGWWPLNGNAQDYSGNNNDGTATGVTYTSAWTSGYTAP